MRIVHAIHSYSGTESFGGRRLIDFGLPLLDVFVARNEERERAYVMGGDAAAVLGKLAAAKEYAR
jgi:hypothetical protein